MDSVRLDSNKSLEIMHEIVMRINIINDDIKLLKDNLSENAILNIWNCNNAKYFSENAIRVTEKFNNDFQNMYRNILHLIESIENYTSVDKEVLRNIE